MRKLKFLAVAAIAVAAVGTGVYTSVKRSNDAVVSDVALANVEALADGESGGGQVCYNTITTKDGNMLLYCQTCSWIPGTNSWFSGKGHC